MQAIILKKNIFSEGNEIITMYSRELGKIRAVAKAVKSPKSRLSFGLQNLFLTDVDVLISKKLSTIKGVKALETFPNIYSDEQNILLALYATEIILKSTPDEEKNENLFDLYLNFLRHLNTRQDSGHGPCADVFVLEALAESGYALSVEKCAVCGRHVDGAEAHFSNRNGGLICAECARKVTDARPVSELAAAILRQTPPADFCSADSSGVNGAELHKLADNFAAYILERDLNASGLLSTL